MTRIPYLDNTAGLGEEALQVFDDIKASRGNVIGVFALLLNSPPVAKLVADVGAYLRFDSILSQRLKELIILTTLSETSCQFEWSFHEGFGLAADIPVSTIDILKFKKLLIVDGQPTPEYTALPAEDAAIIIYTRELINKKRVREHNYNNIRDIYNTQEITEITALIGYYSLVACQLNAYELPAAEGQPSLPEPDLDAEYTV